MESMTISVKGSFYLNDMGNSYEVNISYKKGVVNFTRRLIVCFRICLRGVFNRIIPDLFGNNTRMLNFSILQLPFERAKKIM